MGRHPLSDDASRSLSPRGRQDLLRLGRWLRRENIVPQRILCSTATRTRESWQELSEAFENPPAPDLQEALYGASPLTLLRAVQAAPGDIRCLLMIAHNPEVGALARALAGPASDPVELEPMRRGFAPGDLAILSLAIQSWAEAEPAGGRLLRFVSARQLPADSSA